MGKIWHPLQKDCPTIIDKNTMHYTDIQKYKYLYIDKFYQIFKILGKIIEKNPTKLVAGYGAQAAQACCLSRIMNRVLCKRLELWG